MSVRDDIDDFLKQRRLALVGVSRGERDFSRLLYREFVRRGYDAIPVNPSCEAIDGRPCYHSVHEITPPVDGALLLTPPGRTESVVMDCAQAGIRRIWMYRSVGKGAVSSRAVGFCKSKGLRVIAGYCPYMFWNDVPFFHRLHGFFVKLSM
jgi:predicted CoA-binding protein